MSAQDIYHFIYETTNLINGKKYRGAHSTKDIYDTYLGSGTIFLRAVKKYGRENFQRQIIEFAETEKELYELEKIYVNEEWVLDDSNYNCRIGGKNTNIILKEGNLIEMQELITPQQHKTALEKGRLFWNEKYGVDNPFQAEYVKEKIKNTNIRKYGAKSFLQSELERAKEIRNICSKRMKNLNHTNIICEHCSIECNFGNYKKYHGKKCKENPNREITLHICPHCLTSSENLANMNRYHFDRCRRFVNNI